VAPVAEDRVTTPAPVPAHTAAPAHTAVATPTQSAPTSAPIQVKTQLQHAQQPSTVKAAATQDAPEPPPISNLGATARPDALNTIARSTPAALPAIATPHNISQGVSAGLLVKKVQPVYPSQALQMHIQGNVSLIATIAKDGSIKDVKVVSGPAPLVRAATDAVRQWKYRPYTLNGEPVEIQTEININFVPPR
jgi:protein TonB